MYICELNKLNNIRSKYGIRMEYYCKSKFVSRDEFQNSVKYHIVF